MNTFENRWFSVTDIKTIEKSFSFDLDTNVVEVITKKRNCTENIEHDILFYDVGEMFVLPERQWND